MSYYKKTYTISGTWENGSGKVVYLKKELGEKQFQIMDSAIVKDNQFQMSGAIPQVDKHILALGKDEQEVLLDGEPIEVVATQMTNKNGEKIDAYKVTIKGSHEQEIFRTARDLSLGKSMMGLAGMFAMVQVKDDSVKLDSTYRAVEMMKKAVDERIKNFVDSNNNSLAITYVIGDFIAREYPFEDVERYYNNLTPEQQKVVDEAGQKAVDYERAINRAGDDEIMDRWQNENGVKITKYEDMDIDSFKQAVDGVDAWYQNELESQGYDDAKDLIEAFTKKDTSSASTYDVEDRSDLDWPEQTWNFTCSTTETSTWAEGGRKFGELIEKATGGKIKVNVYAADQLTNGNQSEGIQALIDGDPVQISMHSNLIYSAFDPRFNVVSLPFLFDSVEDADAKLDGEAGEKLKAILDEYGLHCMGIAENGFRQLTNSKQEVKTVDDMKNLKIRVAGSNLLMECYKRWGADATNMNWAETYTALQQKTVEGQENPLPAIDAASVQEVQPYCSMWNAIYDCLFFCINGDIYDSLTPEQQQVVDEAGQKAVEYERYINRSGDEEIMSRWEKSNGVNFTKKEDMDIDSFKKTVEGVDEWFVEQLKDAGYDDGQELVDLFEK